MRDENNLRARELTSHIDKTSGLSLALQSSLLGVSRSSCYYQPVPVPIEDILAMNRIDELNTKRPYFGSRRVADELDMNRGVYPIY